MSQARKSKWKVLCVVVLAGLLAGCAAPPAPEKRETVFFPEAPNLPRYQFLRSFVGAQDIEPEESAFDVFVTGQRKAKLRLDKPYGVAVHDGRIFVCDTNSSLMVFDLKQKKFARLEGAKGLGKLVQPVNVSIGPDGGKYVADPVRGQVVYYDRNDFYVRAYGIPVDWRPVDAVPYGDRLYVVDRQNAEIKVFDRTGGGMIKSIGSKGEPEARLGLPTNIAFDKNGTLYVSDAGRFQVLKYDLDGHYLGKIGNPGQNPGYFARPRGVAVDREGRIYAVDAAFDNVQVFMPDGQLLVSLGKAGKGPGDLFLPAKVYIDYDNIDYFKEYIAPGFKVEYLVLVTSQFGDRPVSVYGFGKAADKHYPSEEELKKEALDRAKKWKEEHPEGGEEETEQGPAGFRR